VIKFVSDLWQVGGFLWVLQFPPPIKIDRHDITEILLKVVDTPQTKPINHDKCHLHVRLFTKSMCEN
jgi:hypothetical protein